MRIVKETGKPFAQVARDLRISEYTLHNSVKADQADQGRGGGLSFRSQAELARLRKALLNYREKALDGMLNFAGSLQRLMCGKASSSAVCGAKTVNTVAELAFRWAVKQLCSTR